MAKHDAAIISIVLIFITDITPRFHLRAAQIKYDTTANPAVWQPAYNT